MFDEDDNNLQLEQKDRLNQLIEQQDNKQTEPISDSQQPINEVSAKKSPFNLPKKIIFLVIALIATTLIGFTLVGADLWYQNPDKVLNDSIINAFTSKTSIYDLKLDATDEVGIGQEMNLNLQLNAKQIDATGELDANLVATIDDEKYTIGAEAMLDDKGDLYFMVKDIKSIINKMKQEFNNITPDMSSAIDKIVAKIDSTWIKISSDDVSTYNKDLKKSKECVNDALNQLKNDRAISSEVKSVYEKNPFIVVDKELGINDGNFGYEVKGSNQNLKNFLDGLKETSLYKELNSCDDNIKIDTTNMDTSEDIGENVPIVELWVNPWSHRISKINVKDNSKTSGSSMIVLMQYDKKFEINTPSEYISLSDLQSYVEELIESFYSSYSEDL